MTNNEINELKMLSSIFRKAIEQCKLNLGLITLHDFPNGSCGEASLLLAKYLQENGYTGFYYVQGSRKNKSHAWLLKEGVCIDITADQFSDNNKSVIVCPISSWHNSFSIENEHIADFNIYVGNVKKVFQSDYNFINKYISKTN